MFQVPWNVVNMNIHESATPAFSGLPFRWFGFGFGPDEALAVW
jgi:hypothetical protein